MNHTTQFDIKSTLQYEDYAVLVTLHDALTTNSSPEIPHDWSTVPSAWRYANECSRYRNNVVRLNKAWEKENRRVGKARVRESMDSFLFRPASFLAFGEFESLSATAIDDLSAMTALTSNAECLVKRASLAYCPSPACLVSHLKLKRPELFESFRDLFGNTNSSGTKERVTKHGSSVLSHPDFMKERPLVVFSRFKLNGTVLLGHGVQLIEALYRAAVQRIDNAVADLGVMCKKEYVRKRDLNNIKCVLLDCQGFEEFALLTSCTNLTVAASIVGALRGLKMDDLFAVGNALESEMLEYHAQNALHFASLEHGDSTKSNSDKRLGEIHVFQSSFSVSGVAPPAYNSPAEYNLFGSATGATKIRVTPGHSATVLKEVGDILKKYKVRDVVWKGGWHSAIGNADLLVPFHKGGRPSKTATPGLPIQTIIHLSRELCGLQDKMRKNVDVNVFAMTTVAPWIQLNAESDSSDDALSKDYREVFAKLPHRVFGIGGGNLGKQQQSSVMDIHILEEALNALGVPQTLCITVLNLYQRFAHMLSDPVQFDNCLDLTDAFLTLHRMLTGTLLRKQSVFRKQKGILRDSFFDDHAVSELAKLAGTLQNALDHRECRAYDDSWDSGTEVRGGVNQLMLTADVPLKIGMGLVYSQLDKNYFKPKLCRNRDRGGAVPRISLGPETSCTIHNIGSECDGLISTFRYNLDQLLFPASFVDFLHETGHILWRATRAKQKNRLSCTEFGCVEADKSEYFALLVEHLLVFGKKGDLFIKNEAFAYAIRPESVIRSQTAYIERTFAYLLRVFVVYDLVQQYVEHSNGDEPYKWGHAPHPLLDGGPSGIPAVVTGDAWTRFDHFVKECFPLVPYLKGFWGTEPTKESNGRCNATRDYCRLAFSESYPTAMELMSEIWPVATDIVRNYMKSAYPAVPDVFDDIPNFRQQIREAFTKGSPVCCHQYPNPRYYISESMSSPYRQASVQRTSSDKLFFVCEVIRGHVEECFGGIGPDKRTIQRCGNTDGRILYASDNGLSDENDKPWSEVQIQRGFGGMYSARPSVRRERLLHQIAFHKTLWDVSTHLRGRRLTELICKCFPDVEKQVETIQKSLIGVKKKNRIRMTHFDFA